MSQESDFSKTLLDPAWMFLNEAKLKGLLPEVWTHFGNIEALQIGWNLKLIGVDWRDPDDIGHIMRYLEKIGILLRDGMTIKRNPHTIFSVH